MNLFWYNYKLEKYESIATPKDFHDYIPQYPAAQSLYNLYVNEMGNEPLEAARKVLEACAGRVNVSAKEA